MDRKVTGIIAYLGWIGWLIAYIAGDKEGAKFHLNQALVLAIISTVGGAIFGAITGVLTMIPLLGGIFAIVCALVTGVWGIIMLIFMILGIVNAANDQDKPLPAIGGIQILN